MLIYVNILDRQTVQTYQKYSSEPHKIFFIEFCCDSKQSALL